MFNGALTNHAKRERHLESVFTKSGLQERLENGETIDETLVDDPVRGKITMKSDAGGLLLEIDTGKQIDTLRFDATEDILLTWGGNGPKVLKGAELSGNGLIQASGNSQLLLRFSDVGVSAGENTTIVNFGSGGSLRSSVNTTYKGAYGNSRITGGYGTTTYDGLFKESSITNDLGESEFDGIFRSCSINNTGSKKAAFEGFCADCAIAAGSGGDSFNGMFIGSHIKGGAGNDSFGGKFKDSTLLGEAGDDNFSGAFFESNAYGNDGDDTFDGYFAYSGMYGGKGKDRFGGSDTDVLHLAGNLLEKLHMADTTENTPQPPDIMNRLRHKAQRAYSLRMK